MPPGQRTLSQQGVFKSFFEYFEQFADQFKLKNVIKN